MPYEEARTPWQTQLPCGYLPWPVTFPQRQTPALLRRNGGGAHSLQVLLFRMCEARACVLLRARTESMMRGGDESREGQCLPGGVYCIGGGERETVRSKAG